MVGPNIITFRDITGKIVIIDRREEITINHHGDKPSVIKTLWGEYKVDQQEVKRFVGILAYPKLPKEEK